MRVSLFLVLALTVSSAFAEKHPFERYQSILDRQMFGLLPPGFDPNKLPSEVQKSSVSEKELTKEQEQLKSAIHFSVINVASDGLTQVGFTDNSDPKVPRNYFLKVGESRDGWTVKEADAEKASMTIVKGEIEVSLTLGGNSAKDGGTSRAGGSTTLPASISKGGVWRSQRGGTGLLGGNGSLRARRIQQRQQEAAAAAAKQQEEQAAREAERQAQAEQEKAQREQERAEQRQQLLAIQEELKRVRETKAAAETEKKEGSSNAQDDAQ